MTDEVLGLLRDNAFHVLGLTPSASRHEVERQGQLLLGMLSLGLAAAKHYPTPVGQAQRDEDKVRLALAKLRDPDRRLEEELWARLPLKNSETGEATDLNGLDLKEGLEGQEAPKQDRPFRDALAALGWRQG